MTPESTLILAFAFVGLFFCVAATAVLVFTPAGRGRSRAERDAFKGMVIGVALMGIAYLLQGQS